MANNPETVKCLEELSKPVYYSDLMDAFEKLQNALPDAPNLKDPVWPCIYPGHFFNSLMLPDDHRIIIEKHIDLESSDRDMDKSDRHLWMGMGWEVYMPPSPVMKLHEPKDLHDAYMNAIYSHYWEHLTARAENELHGLPFTEWEREFLSLQLKEYNLEQQALQAGGTFEKYDKELYNICKESTSADLKRNQRRLSREARQHRSRKCFRKYLPRSLIL